MIIKEEENRIEQLREVAGAMMAAARTAPKACGVDHLEIASLFGADELHRLADAMRRIGKERGGEFFLRDADNIEASGGVVLIGTKHSVRGLDCGLCGFPSCMEKERLSQPTPCVFNVNDLGLAVGSAVSVAADRRVDNRVLFSAGVAARESGLLPGCSVIFAIPLSCTGKNPFFDRAKK